MWFFGKRAKTAPNALTVRFDERRADVVGEPDLRAWLVEWRSGSGVGYLDVIPIALESIKRGRDVAALSKALIALGMAGSDAGALARFIHNRATRKINTERQLRIGVTRAVWRYSGAPCMENPKDQDQLPQDRAHAALNGVEFDLRKGCMIGSRRTWPGDDPGCKCVGQPIIPGFD